MIRERERDQAFEQRIAQRGFFANRAAVCLRGLDERHEDLDRFVEPALTHALKPRRPAPQNRPAIRLRRLRRARDLRVS